MVGEDAAVVDDEAQTKGWILGALAVRRVAVLRMQEAAPDF